MGLSATWARRLPNLLDATGFGDISASTEGFWFRPGSEHAEFVTLSFEQALPVLDEESRNVVSKVIEELSGDPGSQSAWYPSFAVVAARGRRPA